MRAAGWLRAPALLVLLVVAGPLAGCSGTPFGDQLSRSFSSPTTAEPAPAPAGQSTGGAAAPGVPPGAPAPAQTAPQTPAQAAQRPPRAPVLSPAPYRITIKLVGADPAAPAEAVTEALRAAGVPFEVEMIERVQGAVVTPPATPAPAPGASQAPASAPAATPAPEPR
ncbi:hypothetical protein [Cyanobium sp. NIES-981]|uniref:hypothetical protein n=1 Tax=Cyanobium sp. NIES-981 TaxID=1851505 RepID=UPI0018D47BC5|nr:hypothetical protein [Cyanobium sp. NIES-981]